MRGTLVVKGLILQLASSGLQNYYKGYTNILSGQFFEIATKMANIVLRPCDEDEHSIY